MQTKLDSFIEAVVNVFIGYLVSIGMQYLIFPLYGLEVSFKQHLEIGIFFMIASILRSYIIRRMWNKKHEDHRC